ncbi:hypothetical protein F4778DRAFT_172613 [Xylariomycetidae sp. FL2044]|nr:hypothetical protein F4778DRAFT_172613 [Xylariomycetidae sp. FL2044]
MTTLQRMISYVKETMTPYITSPSQDKNTRNADGQPTDASNSYFPETSTSSSSRSSLSSDSTTERTPSSPTTSPQSPSVNSPIGPYKLPALERTYPRPQDELNVEKQLAKDPLPWGLHHSLKRSATSHRKRQVESQEDKARKFAAAKREMLELAARGF